MTSPVMLLDKVPPGSSSNLLHSFDCRNCSARILFDCAKDFGKALPGGEVLETGGQEMEGDVVEGEKGKRRRVSDDVSDDGFNLDSDDEKAFTLQMLGGGNPEEEAWGWDGD